LLLQQRVQFSQDSSLRPDGFAVFHVRRVAPSQPASPASPLP
jgi:hypothetical protein